MKFILFVEGATEKQGAVNLVRKWLDARLKPNHVGVKPIDLKGFGNFVKEIGRKARLHLNGPDRDKIVGAVGMLDLYGPNIFPDRLKTSADLYNWGKSTIEKEVSHESFRMFFAVHDVEAWILSQPDLLPFSVGQESHAKMERPEEVNLHEPPAKLLTRLYRSEKKDQYKKLVHGKQLFDQVDPEIAYQKCPHLKDMLDEMLKMARDRGL